MKFGRFCGVAATFAVAGFATIGAQANDNKLPSFNKVVVVVEENEQQMSIVGNSAAPYTNWLASHGALFTNSWGTEHPSQPNYLDLFSGSDQNIYSDDYITNTPFSGDNLGAKLLHHGLTFAGYSEDLAYVGDTTDNFVAAPGDPAGTHDYARKHNPWAMWQNDAYPASVANQGSNYLPSTVNQPLDPFAAINQSGAFDQLPTVSFVVPNQQHDDHGVTGGADGDQLISDGDTWLQKNIGAYAEWAKKNNSLLIVTWDEDDYTSINKIATIFYGAHVKTGQYPENDLLTYVSTVNMVTEGSAPIYQTVHGINHWNVLRTIEDIYHLGHCGQDGKVKPVTDAFNVDN
jgi:hypothetical protein